MHILTFLSLFQHLVRGVSSLVVNTYPPALSTHTPTHLPTYLFTVEKEGESGDPTDTTREKHEHHESESVPAVLSERGK